jgi:1-acyl-sn-glycerol-3-phosphate acyltransferase
MPVPTGPLRLLFTTSWTAVWASAGIALHAVTGDGDRFRWMERKWAEVLARAWGMEVRVVGAERMDPAGTYVVMANHQSHTDIVALFCALPVVPGFLAKKELRRVPFLGRAMEVGGHVFIDRRQRAQAFEALEDAAKAVRAGATIVVFPEGTRGDRPEIGPLKKGGFHLAMRAGVPLVPVGLRGTARILPKHTRMIRPGTVEVHIGEPILPEEITAMGLEALMARVRNALAMLADMPLGEGPRRR